MAAPVQQNNLHCYGENSFTFLLFQALREKDRFRNLLLKNLRQFGTKKNFNLNEIDEKEETDIWLFPNFGKNKGFGEPDALVLFGNYSFWFEVETVVNLQSGLLALKRSLLQMARFHFLDQALKRRPKTRTINGVSHEAIIGPTIRNDGHPREGILRVAKHPVLKRILRDRPDREPHYVLLSEAQSTGYSDGRFAEELGKILEDGTERKKRASSEHQRRATLKGFLFFVSFLSSYPSFMHLSNLFPSLSG